MKCLLIVVVLCIAGVYSEKYPAKYDKINLMDILTKDRLLRAYLDCILWVPNSKCEQQALFLRDHIKEAIGNNCKDCTDTQKIGTFRGIEYLQSNKPDVWVKIQNHYDPNGSFLRVNHDKLHYVKTHKPYPQAFKNSEFLALWH